MMPADRTVVCALGMHRSGTSLTSRILNLLGVYLGSPQAISGAAADNPKGYWEHHPLALLNDDILIHYDGRWDTPPAFPPGWHTDPALHAIADRARRLLSEEFAGQPLWGWKDPRTCLTTPFWQALVGPMRYVLCMRNPRAVAESLARRDAMPRRQADRLWLTYTGAGLMHTTGQPRMFVFYEDLMADWRPELQRLAAFVGRPERAADPAVQASVAEFIEQELYHHHSTVADMATDPAMSLGTKSLYLAIRAHTSDREDGPDGGTTLDALAEQALTAAHELESSAAERHALIVDRDRIAAERNDLMAERDRLLLERRAQESQLSALGVERDHLAAAVTAGTVERERILAAAQADEAERDRAIAVAGAATAEAAGLTANLMRTRQALEEIETSSAWAMVTFLRRAIGATLPPGTRRGRAFTSVTHRIARRLRGRRPGASAVDSRMA